MQAYYFDNNQFFGVCLRLSALSCSVDKLLCTLQY